MNEDLAIFIQARETVHNDGSRLIHYAEDPNGNRRSTMPVTPFVYEFFLYNSLYSINWEESLSSGRIRNHPTKGKGYRSEPKKQEVFEQFLKQLAEDALEVLRKGFLPLAEVSIEGTWTTVQSDAHISVEEAEAFFSNLKALQNWVKEGNSLDKSRLDQVFTQIKQCREFVYNVRNNIFHGTKDMGKIWDDNQKQRIETYCLFLHCLLSSFFGLASKKQYLIDYTWKVHA